MQKKLLKLINAVMQNDETSTDEELKKYFQKNGLSVEDAESIVSQRPKFFAEPCFEIADFVSRHEINKTQPKIPAWTCSLCGEETTEFPALSRRDNKTKICGKCALQEAMIDLYLAEAEAASG